MVRILELDALISADPLDLAVCDPGSLCRRGSLLGVGPAVRHGMGCPTHALRAHTE